MVYILFFVFSFGTALSAVLKKKYSKMTLNSVASGEIFLFVISVVSVIFYAFSSGFDVVPNLPTLAYSAALALLAGGSVISDILALRQASVITVSIFQNSGMIAIAYIFGVIFMQETVSVFNILACFIALFIAIQPIFSKDDKSKSTLIGYILCLIIFFIDGSASCLYKLYATSTNVCPNSVLCFWANVFLIPYTVSSLILKRKKAVKKTNNVGFKACVMAIIISVLNCASTLLSIYILKNISLTFYTIGASSITLIFSSILSVLFYGEQLTKKSVLTIILSICSVILGAL